MTTTPNLPPLPIPGESTIVQGFAPDDARLRDYALAAYQAGRDAGIEEAEALAKTRNSVMEPNQQVTPAKTGRDLYREAYSPDDGYAPWCDLDDADQSDWNAKAKEANG